MSSPILAGLIALHDVLSLTGWPWSYGPRTLVVPWKCRHVDHLRNRSCTRPSFRGDASSSWSWHVSCGDGLDWIRLGRAGALHFPAHTTLWSMSYRLHSCGLHCATVARAASRMRSVILDASGVSAKSGYAAATIARLPGTHWFSKVNPTQSDDMFGGQTSTMSLLHHSTHRGVPPRGFCITGV